MTDPEAGRYKIGTLSRITGLKPELLRAWQRRFDLFEPERTEGRQRLYTPDDLRVAVYVRDLVAAGRSIGAVARRGRADLLEEARVAHPQVPGAQVSVIGPSSEPSPPRADEWSGLVDDLVSGAVDVDPARVQTALARGSRGPTEDFLKRMVSPAMTRIGDLWAAGECSVAGEHLAATLVRERLSARVRAGAPPAGKAAPEAIVACLPDDHHENGALTAAVRMTDLGWRVTWLGAALPLSDLDRACRSRRPHAVFLSATLPKHYEAARPALLAFAKRWQGAFELVIGGQGTPVEDPDLADAGARLTRGWSAPARPEGWSRVG